MMGQPDGKHAQEKCRIGLAGSWKHRTAAYVEIRSAPNFEIFIHDPVPRRCGNPRGANLMEAIDGH